MIDDHIKYNTPYNDYLPIMTREEVMLGEVYVMIEECELMLEDNYGR